MGTQLALAAEPHPTATVMFARQIPAPFLALQGAIVHFHPLERHAGPLSLRLSLAHRLGHPWDFMPRRLNSPVVVVHDAFGALAQLRATLHHLDVLLGSRHALLGELQASLEAHLG